MEDLPLGCVFFSNYSLSTSRACGVKDVRLLRLRDGSLPINSLKLLSPLLYLSTFYKSSWTLLTKHSYFRLLTIGATSALLNTHLSSASCIHLSNTGFIFCALFGVISSFSNLQCKQNCLNAWNRQLSSNYWILRLAKGSIPALNYLSLASKLDK